MKASSRECTGWSALATALTAPLIDYLDCGNDQPIESQGPSAAASIHWHSSVNATRFSINTMGGLPVSPSPPWPAWFPSPAISPSKGSDISAGKSRAKMKPLPGHPWVVGGSDVSSGAA